MAYLYRKMELLNHNSMSVSSSDKKSWSTPTLEIISKNIIKGGPNHNVTETQYATKTSPKGTIAFSYNS